MKVAVALVVFVCCASVGSPARAPVDLLVSPRIAPAPATIRINVLVEPDARNRMLVLEADCEDFFTSSSVQLEGSESRRMHVFIFADLPPGQYVLIARVLRSDGQERRAVADYVVTP